MKTSVRIAGTGAGERHVLIEIFRHVKWSGGGEVHGADRCQWLCLRCWPGSRDSLLGCALLRRDYRLALREFETTQTMRSRIKILVLATLAALCATTGMAAIRPHYVF